MKRKWTWLFILMLALAVELTALVEPRAQAAGSWRCVNPGGTNGCYSSIQSAINDSAYGDGINVASGTYTEHITMRNGISVDGAGWDQTIINGNFSSSASTVYFPMGIDSTTMLAGVQVTGGGTGNPNTSANGGGILILSSSPTVSNTWVYNNTGYWGGGVCVYGGRPLSTTSPLGSTKDLMAVAFIFAGMPW